MRRCLPLLLGCVAAGGCAEARLFCGPPPTPDVVPVGYSPAASSEPPAYRLGCGDVIELTIAGRSGLDGYASVGLDGRLPLGPLGETDALGRTTDELRAEVAARAGVPPDRVGVSLADPRAGRVYLSGPEANRQQVVPFRGPERVVSFLWRVGAMKQGSTDLADVSVVRPNVATGGRPEVFRVDVAAVVLDRDPTTDVWLRSSDQVYVGETKRSRLSRRLPDWLRPLYRKLVGLLPPDGWPWTPAHGGPW